MNKLNKRIILITFLFVILILGDQTSKYIIRHLGGFYICNSGIAFGLNGYFLWIIALIITSLILLNSPKIWSFITKYPSSKSLLSINQLPIIFIISGAISNIIDRITFGCVIDFINLKFWPLFNLADILIVGGAILIVIKNKK